MAKDVTTGPVETLGGEIINVIKKQRGGVKIIYNGKTSNVIKANILAKNGVIHVIDNVIL